MKTIRVYTISARISAQLLAFCMLLVFTGCTSPIKKSSSHSAVTDKSRTTIQSLLSEKKWLLAGYNTGTVYVPLEPDHGSTAWILFRSDGKLNGSTGMNTFTGAWSVKTTGTEGLYTFAVTIQNLTKKAPPNEIAAKFEKDIIRQFEAASRLKTRKDSILLLGGQNETLIECIYRESEVLF